MYCNIWQHFTTYKFQSFTTLNYSWTVSQSHLLQYHLINLLTSLTISSSISVSASSSTFSGSHFLFFFLFLLRCLLCLLKTGSLSCAVFLYCLCLLMWFTFKLLSVCTPDGCVWLGGSDAWSFDKQRLEMANISVSNIYNLLKVKSESLIMCNVQRMWVFSNFSVSNSCL